MALYSFVCDNVLYCTICYIHDDDCNISLVSRRIFYTNLQPTFPILLIAVTCLVNIASRTKGKLLHKIGTSPSHLNFVSSGRFSINKTEVLHLYCRR
jgi:hypothetical protein